MGGFGTVVIAIMIIVWIATLFFKDGSHPDEQDTKIADMQSQVRQLKADSRFRDGNKPIVESPSQIVQRATERVDAMKSGVAEPKGVASEVKTTNKTGKKFQLFGN